MSTCPHLAMYTRTAGDLKDGSWSDEGWQLRVVECLVEVEFSELGGLRVEAPDRDGVVLLCA